MKHTHYILFLALALVPFMGRGASATKPLVITYNPHPKTLTLPNNNPSKDYLMAIDGLQARILQKQRDIEVAKENTARQEQEAAQAALQAQQAPVVIPAPVVVAPQSVQSDDYYVNWIIQHESGGNPYAVNASSGACGLYQRLPCTVTLGDVAGQMADGLAYINSRYGSPYNAYLYWNAHGYY